MIVIEGILIALTLCKIKIVEDTSLRTNSNLKELKKIRKKLVTTQRLISSLFYVFHSLDQNLNYEKYRFLNVLHFIVFHLGILTKR